MITLPADFAPYARDAYRTSPIGGGAEYAGAPDIRVPNFYNSSYIPLMYGNPPETG